MEEAYSKWTTHSPVLGLEGVITFGNLISYTGETEAQMMCSASGPVTSFHKQENGNQIRMGSHCYLEAAVLNSRGGTLPFALLVLVFFFFFYGACVLAYTVSAIRSLALPTCLQVFFLKSPHSFHVLKLSVINSYLSGHSYNSC